jgi:hypothetical protein
MNDLAVFGISVLMSLVSSGVVAIFYVWPRLQILDRERALVFLVVPHMFIRFLGLSFLVQGVVSASLPAAFAVPAAYGDFLAGILAIVAFVSLSKRATWAMIAVWVFNIWGTADFLFAFYQGPRIGLHPADLEAAFFIPTTIVPPMLVAHILTFGLLIQPRVSTDRVLPLVKAL